MNNIINRDKLLSYILFLFSIVFCFTSLELFIRNFENYKLFNFKLVKKNIEKNKSKKIKPRLFTRK